MESNVIAEKAGEYIEKEDHSSFRDEVASLLQREDWTALHDRFYTDLSFGTGGLRGEIGGGFNRMNPYIVRRATQGLANYVLRQSGIGSASAVIAYDSRRYSDLFAQEAALVLAANGIRTYLFSSLRPTPELSFALRRLKATIGIVVTASHNPREYNGYKVYWSDGGQIVPPHDTGIIREVGAVSGTIRHMDKTAALQEGLLRMIDSEIDDPYVEMVKSHVLNPMVVEQQGKSINVVYTPLHGTGTYLVERVLSEMGIKVITVPEQREPDGDFPTVSYPNPEEASAMKMAVSLGRSVDADLVLGTDPDADRLGIAVPGENDFRLITGNQLGALLGDYIFSAMKERGTLPKKPALIKTIVTTELQTRIAASYGAEVYNVLTGFKYIAEKIRQLESSDTVYVFGGEESYGYLVGSEVRDKDAVSAAAMTVEMTLYNKSIGRTVYQHLEELYRQHGYFEEILISRVFKGEKGLTMMENLMNRLRESPPEHIGTEPLKEVKDYLSGTTDYIGSGKREKNIDLPSSNVLQFILADETIVTARPSGTEPKIKFYASCRSEPGMELREAKDIVRNKLLGIRGFIEGLFGE